MIYHSFIKTENKLIKVDVDDIVTLEKRKDGTLIRVLGADGKKFTLILPGLKFEEALEAIAPRPELSGAGN